MQVINLRAKRGGSLFEGRCMRHGSPAHGGSHVIFGPKSWNILTKLSEKVDFNMAESVAWFVF